MVGLPLGSPVGDMPGGLPAAANNDSICPTDDVCKKRQIKLEREKQFFEMFYSGPTGTIITPEQVRNSYSEWVKDFNMRVSSHNRSCPAPYRVEPVGGILSLVP